MRLHRLIIGGGILTGLMLVAVKPAVVSTEHQARLLLLFRSQPGQIRFINSITHKPVVIDFRVGRVFKDFSVATDPLTEAYYTSGTYSINQAVAAEETAVLNFCSLRGISLKLGFYQIELTDGCLEVRLLWTI